MSNSKNYSFKMADKEVETDMKTLICNLQSLIYFKSKKNFFNGKIITFPIINKSTTVLFPFE